MKQQLVDYHFHPNLSLHSGRARTKCKRVWKQWSDKQIDVVVVTEHVFKNPRRAYRLLQEMEPTDSSTVIYPGIEALTAEGIDVIVFAEHPAHIYNVQELMVPKQLTIEKMVTFINADPNLFGSIPHAFSPGNSSIAMRVGMARAKDAIYALGGLEVNNACFRGSKLFADRTGLAKVFTQTRKKMNLVNPVPEDYIDQSRMQLLTSGSDAHVLADIGSGLHMNIPEDSTDKEVFSLISHNTTATAFHVTDEKIYFWLSFYKIYSVIVESLTKAFRLYEGKVYQHDDQFTNFYSEAEKEAVLIIREQRAERLKPMLNFLTYFEFTPSTLNVISLTSILFSYATISWAPMIAVFSFCFYLLSASLTGALARYQEKESEAGAVTKIAVQYMALFGAILVTLWFKWADPFWAACYLGLYTIMLWLLVTLNQVGRPMRFIFRSKLVVIMSIFLFALTGFNSIDPFLVILSIYMAITNVHMLYRLRKAYDEPDEIMS